MTASCQLIPMFSVRLSANMANKTLGEVVRDGRNNLEIALRELARRLHVTPSYVSDIENDRRVPSEDVLRRLAEVLQVPLDDLIGPAGRLGPDTDRYLRQTPAATTLFRRIAAQRLDEDGIHQLNKKLDEIDDKAE